MVTNKVAVAEFNIRRNDIAQIAGLAGDSARVVGRYSAIRFSDFANEAHYFSLGIDYHAFRIRTSYEGILKKDREIYDQAGGHEYVIMGGRRPDVLATTFEFDSLLVYTRSLFDRILQLLMTPLDRQLPKSITQFEKKFAHLRDHPIVCELLDAWTGWGKEAKEYRDCLLHYWTFYKGTYGVFKKGSDREILIPDNPTANSPGEFSYDRKVSLADYAAGINSRCQSLLLSIVTQIFESLLKEEFGVGYEIQYWDKIPEIRTDQIKESHAIYLSPGLAWDKGGRITRSERLVTAENGEIKYKERVPYEWLKDAVGEITITSDESYLMNTEFPVALKKMYDIEHGQRKGRRRRKSRGGP